MTEITDSLDSEGESAESTEHKRQEMEVLQPEEETLLHQVESNPRIMDVMQRRYHSGPLPSADDLVEYDRIIPNGADRIMKMAEKEQEGRLSQTANNSQSFFKMKARGQWFGLLVVLIFSGLAFFLFYKEEYGLGVTLLSANLVSIIAIFVADRFFHAKNEDYH